MYDTDRNITWLANANLAASNTFGVAGIAANGSMNWSTAQSWIAAMNAVNYLGYSDWRLPTTLQPDASCGGGVPNGYNCTGSEMGHLFYIEWGGVADSTPLVPSYNANYSLFSNVQSGIYWSGTDDATDASAALTFQFNSNAQGDYGFQSSHYKYDSTFYAMAVRTGNVAAALPALQFQWPLAPFTSTPIVTQDYACRGTTNLITGTVDDVCFSPTTYHSGIDIKPTTSDTTVYATGAGAVMFTMSSCVVGDTACNGGFGNWVIIDHGSNVYSLYAHLQQNSLTVAPGSVVTQGQALATMGATGNVTGPHLHFAMGGIEAAPFLGAFLAGHPGAYGYYDPWTYISTSTFIPTPVRVVNAAGLNVRRGPGTNYSVFTEVSYNQVFVAFAKVGDWYRIHLPCGNNSCAAWISAQSIHSVVDPSVTQVQVTGTGTAPLNVRSTPNSNSTALDKIYLNQKFAVSGNPQTLSGSGCAKPWYPVYLPLASNAASGWLCGDYLAVTTGGGTPVFAARLNDTGITTFGDAASNTLPTEPADYPGQDASYGRDAAAQAGTLTKIGGGRAGFDFTKLDSNGNGLPASATSWNCVRDNVTGLIWEVKTDDGGLRDKDNTYSWYNPDNTTNGGSAGTQNGGSCTGGIGCDTHGYTQAVNNQVLCGHNDWRLPWLEELRSLVDYSIPYPGPTIDTGYFPNTVNAGYFWSASPYANGSGYAWYVNFGYGDGGAYYKSDSYHVRLVRGGQ